MPYGMYLSAEGAQAQAQRLEVLSNNLANVDTPGFKRQLAVFRARYAEETERGLDFPGSGSINDVGGGIYAQLTKTDFSAGPVQRSGIPTDLAIAGDGFFMIEKDGEKFVTRAGDFRTTTDGRLVTRQGHAVLNTAGVGITFDPDGGPVGFMADGGVTQSGVRTGQDIAVVLPESLERLQHAGGNLFRLQGEAAPVTGRRFATESLEMSGVKPALEMMELTETSRMFEANVSMIRYQDQMLAALVNRALRV